MEKQEILAIYGTEYKEMTKTLLKEADLEGRILKKVAENRNKTEIW